LDSKITDKNIPTVINIANDEQTNKNSSMIFSTLSLALNSFLIFLKVKNAVKKNIKIDRINKIFLNANSSGKIFFSKRTHIITSKIEASDEFIANIAP